MQRGGSIGSMTIRFLGTLDDEIALSRTNEFDCQESTNRESFLEFKKCEKCEYSDEYEYNANYYDSSNSSYGYYGYYGDEPSKSTVSYISRMIIWKKYF